jgi:hypothetical protein
MADVMGRRTDEEDTRPAQEGRCLSASLCPFPLAFPMPMPVVGRSRKERKAPVTKMMTAQAQPYEK